MSATYTYSVSQDFPNGVVSIPSLTLQIDASTITSSALMYINVGTSAPDNCDIVFAAALSGAEVTTLNGLVAAHTGVPPYVPPASEFGWTTVVLSASVATPPVSPTIGDTYVIPEGATGAWAGYAQQYTSWNGVAWEFMLSPNGYATWVDDVNQVFICNAANWEPLDHFLPLVTETDSGLMSVADKIKLDTIAEGATVTTWATVAGALGGQAGAADRIFISDGAGGGTMGRNIPTIPGRILVGTNADTQYNTIKEGVAAAVAGGASNSNPFTVLVAPGSYSEDKITIPPGVTVSSLTGTRFKSVIVTANTASDDLFVLTGGTLIGLDLQGVTDAAKALIRCATPGQPSKIMACAVTNCSTGLLVTGAGVNTLVIDFTVAVSAPASAITTGVKVVGGALLYMDIFTAVCPVGVLYAPGNPIEKSIFASGVGTLVTVKNAFFSVEFNTSDAVCVFAEDGAYCQVAASEFELNNAAICIGSSGPNTVCIVQGGSFLGNIVNFDVKSSTGVIHAITSVDAPKRTMVDGSKFYGILQERDNPGLSLIGDVQYEFLSGRTTTFSELLHTMVSSGIISGGVVSNATGLSVNVAAGKGWIHRHDPTNDILDVSWTAASALSLPASTTNYVAYNGETLLVETTTTPPADYSILLAIVVTDGTGVRFNHRAEYKTVRPGASLHDYLLATRKFAFNVGLAVSQGSSATKFTVAAGSYFRALTKISYGGATDATFSYFYGTNGATEVASQTDLSTTQWDNAGTLTALTTGKFRMDTALVTSDGRVSVLYGTAEFDTEVEAEEALTAALPTFVQESGFLLAKIVVEEGVGIASIVDIRKPGENSAGGGSAGVSAHGAMSGLTNDDHTQYLLSSGGRPMSGNLDIGGNNIANVGTVSGVVISAHASRHNPGGADALATGTPVAVQVGVAAGAGSAASYALSDHQHGVVSAVPVEVGTTNEEGSASTAARSDHVHAHGNLVGGTNHAVASTAGAGFLPKSNFEATANPGASDDLAAGYLVGSRWINVTSDAEFVCVDAAAAAAVWKQVTDGATKNDAISVYDNTGGISFTGAAITVAFDTTQTNTNGTLYVFASNSITVNTTGVYLLSYNVSVDALSASARTSSRVWLERNTVLIPGTTAFGYHRQATQGEDTMSCTTVMSVTAGDGFRVQAQVENGTGSLATIAGASRFTVTRLA